MSIYAIGDIQGCYQPLRRLLDKLQFDAAEDTLWIAGDLVNRGPQSLETLRYVRSLGDAAVCVLGNHDFHLMALHYGLREPRSKDHTLEQVLQAPDRDEIIEWLRHLPIMFHDDNHRHTLVHAGIHPQWTIPQAATIAAEIEALLRCDTPLSALRQLYGATEGDWQTLQNTDWRLRYALNCFTRMRFCDRRGEPDYSRSDAPGAQPDHLLPWFDVSPRGAADHQIIFGHWAALGLHQQANVLALDSGCVWGNSLTAARIPDFDIVSVSCP